MQLALVIGVIEPSFPNIDRALRRSPGSKPWSTSQARTARSSSGTRPSLPLVFETGGAVEEEDEDDEDDNGDENDDKDDDENEEY